MYIKVPYSSSNILKKIFRHLFLACLMKFLQFSDSTPSDNAIVHLLLAVSYIYITLVKVNDLVSLFAERHESARRVASNCCCSCNAGAGVNAVNSLEITSTRDLPRGRQVSSVGSRCDAAHRACLKPFCIPAVVLHPLQNHRRGRRDDEVLRHESRDTCDPGDAVNFVDSRS